MLRIFIKLCLHYIYPHVVYFSLVFGFLLLSLLFLKMSSERKIILEAQWKVRSLQSAILLWFYVQCDDWRGEVQTRNWELRGPHMSTSRCPPKQSHCCYTIWLASIFSLRSIDSMIMWFFCAGLAKEMFTLIIHIHKCVLQNATTMPLKPTLRMYFAKVFPLPQYFDLSLSCSVMGKMIDDECKDRLTGKQLLTYMVILLTTWLQIAASFLDQPRWRPNETLRCIFSSVIRQQYILCVKWK